MCAGPQWTVSSGGIHADGWGITHSCRTPGSRVHNIGAPPPIVNPHSAKPETGPDGRMGSPEALHIYAFSSYVLHFGTASQCERGPSLFSLAPLACRQLGKWCDSDGPTPPSHSAQRVLHRLLTSTGIMPPGTMPASALAGLFLIGGCRRPSRRLVSRERERERER
ncbi:hypothetical protein LZ30DRAFT_239424 [Colletotrichum cereale]|nr:hypothetical protein LZ30DRAFT_239424 [Colletotrichum cereale]